MIYLTNNNEKLHSKEAAIEIATRFDLHKVKKLFVFVSTFTMKNSNNNKITITDKLDNNYLSGNQQQINAPSLMDFNAFASYLKDYVEVEIINPERVSRMHCLLK